MPPTHTDEGLPRGARDPRAPPGHRRARPLAVHRARARDEAARRLGRGRRLPAQGPDPRRRRVRRPPCAASRTAARRSTRSIVSTLLSRERPDDPVATLTPREREVLELMATGSSNQGIAEKLVITVGVVEKYVSSIFDKLGLPSARSESRRVLAVLMFLAPERAPPCAGARNRPQRPQEPPPKTQAFGPDAARPRRCEVAVTPHADQGVLMKTRIIQNDPNEPSGPSRRPPPPKRPRNIAARVGGWSASHWKTAVFGWLAFVVVVARRRHAARHEADRPERRERRRVPHGRPHHRRGRLHGRRERRDDRGSVRDGAHPVEDADREGSGLPGRDRGRREDARRVPAGDEAALAARRRATAA